MAITMSVAALGEVAEMYKHNRELFVQAIGPAMARRLDPDSGSTKDSWVEHVRETWAGGSWHDVAERTPRVQSVV